MILRSAFVIALILVSLTGYAQDQITFSGKFENVPFTEFLNSVSSSTDLDFYYQEDWVEHLRVTGNYINEPLNDVLDDLFEGNDLEHFFYNESSLVIIPSDYAVRKVVQGDEQSVIEIGRSSENPYNKPVNISGKVIDGKDGTPLIGATIISMETKTGGVSDENGQFRIQLPTGPHRLKVASISYSEELLTIEVFSDGSVDVELFENSTELDAVVISARAPDSNVKDVISGTAEMDIQAIRTIPTFMGEVDVVRSLTTLPGVATVGEGSSGYNVRGGTAGENLILQDGVILFNTSHLFGFFSGFNPDLVENATMFKGSMPASYGGRVSSALDVSLKDKASEKLLVRGSIGLVSSRLTVEAGLGDKNSLLLGGRLSYVDWLLKRAKNKEVKQSTAGFGDANLKFSSELGSKDKLVLSGYHSTDRFSLGADTTYRWSSSTLAAEWAHNYSDRLFSNLKVFTGRYAINVDNENRTQPFEYKSSINYSGLSFNFDHSLNARNNLKYGISAINYNFNQGELQPGEAATNVDYQKMQDEKTVEFSGFIQDEIELGPALKLNIGLRYAHFLNLGEHDVYIYDSNQPKSRYSIIDTLQFQENEVVASYGGFEPRFSLRYSVRPSTSFKLGYTRNQQFLQLISNSIAVTPVDLWQPSNYHIKPQKSHQVSLGWFQNIADNTYELSVEGYYKTIENFIDFKGGATLQLNPTLEADLLYGNSRAYGVETLLKKSKGYLTGWVSYTYSRSEAQVIGQFTEETISDGQYYLTNYDKPHDLSVVLNYKFNRRVSFSTNFTYYTGRPITIPVSQYRVSPMPYVLDFSNRNTYRIPDYHRLDLSVTIGQSLKKATRVKSELIFGIYNVYGRKNPYSVYFDQQGNAYQLSILGTVFPYVSYNFEFK